MKKQLLLVEDDVADQTAFKRLFWDEKMQYDYTIADSVGEAKAILDRNSFDIVVTDYLLGDGTGFDILGMNLDVPVIMVTGGGSEAVAVKAMKAGAWDYLIKDPDHNYLKMLSTIIEKVLRLKKTEDQFQIIRERESRGSVIIGMNGLAEVRRLIDLAASADSPVLITGETGTGKNLAAKAIHYGSPSQNAPFVAINCAALPENIIESELFGYEKGAFTGALKTKRGLFEMAEGGTLFLDEIGDMPPHLQAKLLTAIEEKQIRRLGGESARPVSVRITAATGVDIENALGTTFRKDLYYRLGVIKIHIPPLRERRDDISGLCEFFLTSFAKGRPLRIPDSQMDRLMAYDWPGNVRELKNVLERTVILQKGPELAPAEFLPASHEQSRDCIIQAPPAQEIRPIREVEREYIAAALHRFSGHKTRTAAALGIPLATFKRKIKAYGLK